jgi:hypothetical protein
MAATLPSNFYLTVSIFYEGLLVLGVRVSRGGSERVLQRGALLLQGTQARKDDIYKLLYVRILFSNVPWNNLEEERYVKVVFDNLANFSFYFFKPNLVFGLYLPGPSWTFLPLWRWHKQHNWTERRAVEYCTIYLNQCRANGCNHRVHILVEMKQGQCICPLSWSVHCNFTGDGKCNKRGCACTPHPHRPGLILPSSLNVRQKAAVATLCTLWL